MGQAESFLGQKLWAGSVYALEAYKLEIALWLNQWANFGGIRLSPKGVMAS
jgi:hypothetical protein